jgi:hypothetical protein
MGRQLSLLIHQVDSRHGMGSVGMPHGLPGEGCHLNPLQGMT